MTIAAQMIGANPTQDNAGSATLNWWREIRLNARSRARHQVHADAQQIQFHYDVSDAFYELWLDPMRLYSCAYFREPDMSLAQAQQAKLDHICRKLMLKPGERFLDIGAGWGRPLDVRSRALRRARTRHHLVEEPACARQPADRSARARWPRQDGAARLPRAARERALRQDRVGRHVRARRPRVDAGVLREDFTDCSDPAAC